MDRNNEIEDVLEKLGFTRFAGSLWHHPETSIFINIKDEDKPSDIVGTLLKTGEASCQSKIRSALGIDKPYT